MARNLFEHRVNNRGGLQTPLSLPPIRCHDGKKPFKERSFDS